MYTHPTLSIEFLNSLSVGGRDGTLSKRFRDPNYAGRVRGKTGSLNGVNCVAAYVFSKNGDVYSYVFFGNNVRRPVSHFKKAQESMMKDLINLP